MMRLADIPELSESFFSEDSKAHEYRREEEDGVEKRAGEDKYGHYKDYMDDTDEKKGDDSSTHPGRKDYMKEEDAEDEHEEEEIDAMGDELGAEDHEADEEADELDAEASEGDAEITPEAAQAIVDLAAQLEASGALEGGEEEVEAEVEMSDVGGEEEVEIEGEEEIEELEEALAKLGIEVIDDKKLNEAVRKRVIARLRKEKRAQMQEAKVNKIADRIFARLQKLQKK